MSFASKVAVADLWISVKNCLWFLTYLRPIWGQMVLPGEGVLIVALLLCWDETMSFRCYLLHSDRGASVSLLLLPAQDPSGDLLLGFLPPLAMALTFCGTL